MLANRDAIHLLVVVCEQLGLIVFGRQRVLAKVAGVEDPAGELVELFVLDRAQESQTDLRLLSDLLKRNALALPRERKIERGRAYVWRRCRGTVLTGRHRTSLQAG